MKNLVLLAFFSTFVVIVWIGLSIYHNATTSTISPATNIQIQSIPGTFDVETIQSLKQRKVIPVDLKDRTMIPSITPTPPTTSFAGSDSALLNQELTTPSTGSAAQNPTQL